MLLRTISTSNDPMLCQVKKLYESAFPKAERRPFESICEFIEQNPKFRLQTIEVNEQFVGFITSWQLPHCTYIEHFAVDPSNRNHGYGQEVLRIFTNQTPPPIVLEIEIPNNEWAIRRLAFYQRCDFREMPFPYSQPPYHSGDPLLPMRVMTWGGNMDQTTFDHYVEDLYKEVYKYTPIS